MASIFGNANLGDLVLRNRTFRSATWEGLADGDADYVSFSRPLICEPDLIERWRLGDRSKSKCLSCNGCLKEGLKGEGIACVGKRSA